MSTNHRPQNRPASQRIERDPKRGQLYVSLVIFAIVFLVVGIILTGSFDAMLKAIKEGLGL
jgi:hypothetical protein